MSWVVHLHHGGIGTETGDGNVTGAANGLHKGNASGTVPRRGKRDETVAGAGLRTDRDDLGE